MNRTSSKGRPVLPVVRRMVFVFAALLAASVSAHAEGLKTDLADPCAGPSGLLAMLDRPTVSDSACAVPAGHVVLEMGFQHAGVRGPGSGGSDNYPQAEIRAGLPGGNEFVLLPPNYNRQKTNASAGSASQEISGASAVTLGLKHEIGYTSKWLGAVEALFTLPSGGSAFGSKGLGAAVNGIAAYSLSEEVGLALQIGISSQTNPDLAGGGRFTFVSSIIVATWQPMEKLQFYGEVFGQSSTGPGAGAGCNADAGIQYLITPSWEVDVEEGVRLAGNLGGFTHYIGAGTGLRF